jgi:hypothetical protein
VEKNRRISYYSNIKFLVIQNWKKSNNPSIWECLGYLYSYDENYVSRRISEVNYYILARKVLKNIHCEKKEDSEKFLYLHFG